MQILGVRFWGEVGFAAVSWRKSLCLKTIRTLNAISAIEFWTCTHLCVVGYRLDFDVLCVTNKVPYLRDYGLLELTSAVEEVSKMIYLGIPLENSFARLVHAQVCQFNWFKVSKVWKV